VRRFYKAIQEDDLAGISGELAYRLFLSLFPFFIFLGAMGAFLATISGIENPTDDIISLLGDSVPADVSRVLRSQLEDTVGSQDFGLLSIGIAGAIWTASSGFMCLIKGMNRVHETRETRPIWKRYLLAISLVLLAGSSLIAAFLLIVLGQVFGRQIADELNMDAQWLNLIRWPIVIVFVLLAVALIYWITPSKQLPFRFASPGAVIFTAAWLVLNLFFGLYISNLSRYSTTYGALGGIVVVMLWFYLTSFLLFLGAELNQMIYEAIEVRKAPEKIKVASAARAAIEEPTDVVEPANERTPVPVEATVAPTSQP
jgi:membrane protein